MHRLEYVVLVILICLFHGAIGHPRADPLVHTKVGLIRGLNAENGGYSMFLGIPYAKVDPLNPFGPSIPFTRFENTFDAINDAAMCPQRNVFNNTIVGTLDCLHVNVYVPNTANSENRQPVMVYIHGAGYVDGFAGRFLHGAKFLVRHNVIVVTMNYRLGPYGFLCLDTPAVPGNQGLKDQLTALRWVKANIEAFGGDNNKITLFGQSAGAASVDFHLIYAKEDLFNNVIIQSGTAMSPFTNPRSDSNAAFKLAARLGFNTSSLENALQFLRNIDTNLVIAASLDANTLVRPCIERVYDNVESYITVHPIQANISKVREIPIIIGFNNNERGNVFMKTTRKILESINLFASLKEIYDFDSKYLAEMTNIVRHFYIGDEDLNQNVRKDLANFVSDFMFYHPTYRSICTYNDHGASSIYHYMFSYDGNRNFVKRLRNVTNISGALHSDELGYLFDNGMMKEAPTPDDKVIIDRITTLWTNFAKYSNPTPETTDILPILWPTITKETMYYLDINSEISVKKRPFHDRMTFWDLFLKLNKPFVKY